MTVDASKLGFSSEFRYERVAVKSHLVFSVVAFGITTFTIPHNLGYVPFVKAYYTYDNSKYFDLFAGAASYAIGGNGGQIENSYADSTNYYVRISENNGVAIGGTIHYRIYAEPQ